MSWISGGFAVEESIETGNDYTCEGKTGEDVCVWYNVAYTGYTVADWTYNSCTGSHQDTVPYVIWSPNSNNGHGNYYCATGDECATQGDGYWA